MVRLTRAAAFLRQPLNLSSEGGQIGLAAERIIVFPPHNMV